MIKSNKGLWIFLFIQSILFCHCEKDVSGPQSFNNKTVYYFEFPENIDADLYKVMILDSVDTTIYYQKAQGQKIQVALPSELESQIVVEAFKENKSVYKAGTNVIPKLKTDAKLQKITEQEIAAPSSVSYKLTAEMDIDLKWSSINGADAYTVYRSENTPQLWIVVGKLVNCEFTDTNVNRGDKYFYRITASAGTLESDASEVVDVTIPPVAVEKPNAPANITAIALSAGSIKVSWTISSDANSYIVQYSSNSSFVDKTTSSNYAEITGLQPSTGYTIRVVSVNDVGQSAPSQDITCTTLAKSVEKPAVPANVKAVALSEKSVSVTWDKVEGANSYSISYSSQPNGTYTSKTSTEENYVIDALETSTNYYIKVSSANSAGSSDQSAVVNVKTLDPALQPPLSPVLSATMASDTSIQLSWSAVNNASSYIIERALSSTGTFTAVCTTSALSYSDRKCQPSTPYYYKGKASNSAGTSAYSAVVSAKTDIKLAAPSGLTVGTVTDSSIVVTWQSVTGATSYNVYYGTSQNGTYEINGTSISASYVLKKLTASTTYYIKVSCVSGTRESAGSSIVSAKTSVALSDIPAIPSGVTAASSSASSITVKFNTVTSATGYIIYSGKTSTSLTAVDTVTEATFTHSSLTASTVYYYAVAAMNASGVSAKSPVVSATTGNNAPSTPTGLTATSASSTSITVKFNSVTGATGYKLYWSTNNTTYTLLSTLTTTAYTHSSLTANTTYYYKVSAIAGTVESAQSSSVSAKTAAATKVAVIGTGCNGCGRCPSSCSKGAISRSGSKYVIDPAKCDGCGKCVSVCPRKAITLK